jgi:hypothetical protein
MLVIQNHFKKFFFIIYVYILDLLLSFFPKYKDYFSSIFQSIVLKKQKKLKNQKKDI